MTPWRRKDIVFPSELSLKLFQAWQNSGGKYLYILALMGEKFHISLSMIDAALMDLKEHPDKELYRELDAFYDCCLHDPKVIKDEFDLKKYPWPDKMES